MAALILADLIAMMLIQDANEGRGKLDILHRLLMRLGHLLHLRAVGTSSLTNRQCPVLLGAPLARPETSNLMPAFGCCDAARMHILALAFATLMHALTLHMLALALAAVLHARPRRRRSAA